MRIPGPLKVGRYIKWRFSDREISPEAPEHLLAELSHFIRGEDVEYSHLTRHRKDTFSPEVIDPGLIQLTLNRYFTATESRESILRGDVKDFRAYGVRRISEVSKRKIKILWRVNQEEDGYQVSIIGKTYRLPLETGTDVTEDLDRWENYINPLWENIRTSSQDKTDLMYTIKEKFFEIPEADPKRFKALLDGPPLLDEKSRDHIYNLAKTTKEILRTDFEASNYSGKAVERDRYQDFVDMLFVKLRENHE